MKTQQKTTNKSFQKQIKNGLLHFFFADYTIDIMEDYTYKS